MIGSLAGVLDRVGEDHVVISVGGVGYEVYCHGAALAAMPAIGNRVLLHTDLQLRNDLLRLYGFPDGSERAWFRLLIGVQGVGAKGALAILGALGASGLADAIATGESAAMQRAPGIGKRIADRVVHELRNKAPSVLAAVPAAGDEPGSGGAAAVRAEAISALANLGYGFAEASDAVRGAMRDQPESALVLEEVVRRALQGLGRQRG